MAASDPAERKRRSPLSLTQEIPLLEQLLASGNHPDLAGGQLGSRSLRRSTLGGIDERLEELLQIAIENEQSERVTRLINLQESFDQLRRRLEQSLNQSINPADVELFRPLDLLSPSASSSSSSASSSSSSHDPLGNDVDEDDNDDFDLFTWLSPTAEITVASAENCTVCWEPMLKAASLAACEHEHVFCQSCWKAQFEVLICDAELANPFGCLSTGCTATATEGEIASIVGDELFQRYLRFSVLAIVRRDPKTRWCPNIRCEQHVTITDETAPSIQCSSCNTQFCPRCSRRPHPGTACKQKVSETEKELGKWLKSLGMRKAKRCPGCRDLVEKSAGCNHMSCRCGSEWCWLCGWPFEAGHNSSSHFSSGDSLCLGLQFASSDSLREARDLDLGGPGSYKKYRLLHKIETPKQRRLRIKQSGYGQPHPMLLQFADQDNGFGLFD